MGTHPLRATSRENFNEDHDVITVKNHHILIYFKGAIMQTFTGFVVKYFCNIHRKVQPSPFVMTFVSTGPVKNWKIAPWGTHAKFGSGFLFIFPFFFLHKSILLVYSERGTKRQS